MVDWYDGLPTKAGQYLATVVRPGRLPIVSTRVFSKVNGWSLYNGEELLAWSFLPPPWDGQAFSRNPYIDPASVQEEFEQAVRKQLERQAELIRQRKEQSNDDEGKEQV